MEDTTISEKQLTYLDHRIEVIRSDVGLKLIGLNHPS